MAAPVPSSERTSCKCRKCEERRRLEEGNDSLVDACLRQSRSAAEFHSRLLPSDLINMVEYNPCRLCLGRLIDFWSIPSSIRYIRSSLLSVLNVTSWYLSYRCLNAGNIEKAKALLLNGSLLHQCQHSPIEVITSEFRKAVCLANGSFKTRLPYLHEGVLAAEDIFSMKIFLQKRLDVVTNSHGENLISIFLFNIDSQKVERINVGLSTAMKHVFNGHATRQGLSLKFFRFTHNGNTLFLSSISNHTPSQLGIRHLDGISVSNISNDTTKEDTTQFKCKTSCSKQRQKSNRERKTRRARVAPLALRNLNECNWFRHSKALSLVFEEAEPKFKEIRQSLNAMNIDRSRPKQNKSRTEPYPSTANYANRYDNPSTDILGNKAVKTRFLIQVGEVQNLHKTTKPSIAHKKSSFSTAPSRVIELDLHGLTKEEALCKLDQELPKWIDIAMLGSYPWVIPVTVVCGGGGQILSEAVRNWIRQNDKVSNAPKNSFLS